VATELIADHQRNEVAFPRLDGSQVQRIAQCTGITPRRYRAGEILFDVGQRDFQFFVVRTGDVEIVDPSGDTPKTLVVLGPGEFTGDVAHLTGTPAVVRAVARTDCEAYEIAPDGLRRLLDGCPELAEIILHAFIARRELLVESGKFIGPRVIGSRHSKDTFRIREFLTRNRVPFTWLDLETSPEVDRLLKQFGVSPEQTPVVVWGKLRLRNPTNVQLGDALGIRRSLGKTVYDLAVVGGGPAGLAAAVYGASEGLSTVVLENTGPGGQAAYSMRIENYLGFPAGVSGAELAQRAVLQATRFGALLSVPSQVTGLTFDHTDFVLAIAEGEPVVAKCLLIACGVRYRRLEAENCARFEGCGVYYSAGAIEAELCRGSDAVVVGGGNSAGQAAVFLSRHARKVYLVVRSDYLGKNMSSYLVHRIEHTPNIEVLLDSEVRRMTGDEQLRSVEVVNKKTGQVRTIATPVLVSFIGAEPYTAWLPPEIELDERKFVRTGAAVAKSPQRKGTPAPVLLETSRPGAFAAGDVRSGSVKRVASAVGEGAMAVQFVHEYLASR
jgi:thioredoxin reductase (NADPH)